MHLIIILLKGEYRQRSRNTERETKRFRPETLLERPYKATHGVRGSAPGTAQQTPWTLRRLMTSFMKFDLWADTRDSEMCCLNYSVFHQRHLVSGDPRRREGLPVSDAGASETEARGGPLLLVALYLVSLKREGDFLSIKSSQAGVLVTPSFQGSYLNR